MQRIEQAFIEDEMRESYINYAMSVIRGRAIPDVRDGLKPVQRRILYTMYQLGLLPNRPQRKSARIVGECFVAGTLVATDRGLVPIEAVQRGDRVYTENGLSQVSELYVMPPRPLLRVELENGLTNIATPSQPFRVLEPDLSYSWKEASELRAGDWVVLRASAYPQELKPMVLPPFGGGEKRLSERLAYLLGLLISDGWVAQEGKRQRLGFYSCERAVMEHVVGILEAEFGYRPTIEFKAPNGDLRGYTVRVSRDAINEHLIRTFGLAAWRASTKRIPPQILASPKPVVFAFLSGLIDGDGSIHKERNLIRYTSISQGLINDLQVLLHHLNLLARRYSRMPDPDRFRGVNGRKVEPRHPYYWLEISGQAAQNLAQRLSLVHPKKRARCQALLKGAPIMGHDPIPGGSAVVFEALSQAHLGGGWYRDVSGVLFRQGIRYPNGTKIRYSTALLDQQLHKSQVEAWGILEKLERIGSPLADRLRHFLEDGILFAPVARVTPCPPQVTYDLGVRGENQFISNGMVVHNCMGKYHPHGDQAIYDTLVNMAQEFSFRYPLVDGQGNFGCFTGDTRVQLVDGTTKSFKELVEDYEQGHSCFTYTVGSDGRIRVAPIRAPRLTKRQAEIVKVTLDNGVEIRCTPDHRFMLREGTYCQAKDLQPGDSLMPLYRFEHGLERFFGGDLRALHQTCQGHTDQLNHKVISVKPAGYADVYDLTVDETHNFALAAGVFVHNSIDGDEPAAMRYTEARLSEISERFLDEIEEDTTDFVPNFDDSLKEPTVLPTKLPNLLLNGSWGISVGMTTQIPPHNLGELIDATVHLIEHPDAPLERLLKVIKGPDLPTGGIIVGKDGIEQAYRTGEGKIRVRAKLAIEGSSIIVTEIPYQVRKSTILEAIAHKVKSGELDEISDLRDESDREGLRIVIELKRTANPQLAVSKLYKYTPLEWTFGANFLVIVGNNPRKLGLIELLQHFIDFRRQVVRRRTQFRLNAAQQRAHILEGLLKALEHRSQIVELISKTKDAQEAGKLLQKKYELSEAQAEAILKMRLRQFTALERENIAKEYKEKKQEIKEYKEILASPQKLDGIIKAELLELKQRYNDPRRTLILADGGPELDLDELSLIPDMDLLVSVTAKGYVNAPPERVYRRQNRGGKGVIGMQLREGDRLKAIFIANARDDLLIFSNAHKAYKVKAYQLPSARRASKGENLRSLIALGMDEEICAMIPLIEAAALPHGERFCVMATAHGIVNRNPFKEFENAHTSGINALNAEPGDFIAGVVVSSGRSDLLLVSSQGQSARFAEEKARSSGRPSKGVIGMRLNKDDRVVGIVALEPGDPEDKLLFVTENGFGKRTPLIEFPRKGRGGKGVLGIKVDDKTGTLVAVEKVKDDDEIMITTLNGMTIRIAAADVRIVSRYARGVKLIELDPGDKVVAIVRQTPKIKEEGEEDTNEDEVRPTSAA